MKSFAQALFFTTATCATLRPRQSNNGCCFQLASVGKVNETVLEDHVGDLLLGGTFQQGAFCLDKNTKTIQDSLKHNCFMRKPNYQFECYQGAIGTTAFEATSPKPDGKSYLTYDGGPGTFYACPVGSGSQQYYDIYSSEKPNKDGCSSVALALVDETDACSVGPTSNATITARSEPQPTHTVRPRKTPSVCNAALTAPSIAPYQIRTSSSDVAGVGSGSTSEVLISRNSSVTFDYAIPENFFSDVKPPYLCGLEFRMPNCKDLPEGYPCYFYSGIEQEVLSNSGMTFELTKGDTNPPWDNTELHQVFPDDRKSIDVFTCGGESMLESAAREISWKISSVNDFTLRFVQPGVGPNATFQDGIGAFIVPYRVQ
ncbi:hypothetical protein M426DRAFT_20398 [Hypoxylon sp. CI-4A]|nr:hypothetical protein M426DRAFT_20398 [Hypoxylon sp. CI-4A]